MKRKRYSVEQIVAAVRQHDLGVSAADIARKLGIAKQTFYRWKKQLGPGDLHAALTSSIGFPASAGKPIRFLPYVLRK